MNKQPVIKLEGITRRYGSKVALDNISVQVQPGVVLGLVGANGAGKTTLIKHILGLLRAQQGQVRIFGLDPVAHPVEVLGRLGYLSEDRDLPPWMNVAELLRYNQAFYPRWDASYAETLRQQFQLSSKSLVRTLSKGELAKAGLLVALAHRPELLVLDEPSSGLDPIVRRQMLEAVVRSVASEGRTVLFSSHLLDEIARVSDQVVMLAQGRVVLQGPMDQVMESHRRLVVRLPKSQTGPERFPGVLSMMGGPEEWTFISNGHSEALRTALLNFQGKIVEETGATFEENFHARAGQGSVAIELTLW